MLESDTSSSFSFYSSLTHLNHQFSIHSTMSSPPSPLPPREATLRSISALIFLPGFILCIIHGAIHDEVFPAVGGVGLFLSAVFATIVLSRANKGKTTSAWLTYVQDWFMGAVNLMFFIMSLVWLNQQNYYRRRENGKMLGAYATMPILVNL